MQTCESCAFSGKTSHGEARLICRLNPPVTLATADTLVTRFPLVTDKDWCSHHEYFRTEDVYS